MKLIIEWCSHCKDKTIHKVLEIIYRAETWTVKRLECRKCKSHNVKIIDDEVSRGKEEKEGEIPS